MDEFDMGELGMGERYYHLTESAVDRVVTPERGNYALGFLRDDGFVPRWVGRSTNLRGRLKDHVDEGHPLFKFRYVGPERESFDIECANYHAFKKQLVNRVHPRRPKGQRWPCPLVGCRDW